MNAQTIEQMAADAISAVWLARSYEDASRNDGGSCARSYRQLAKMEYAKVVNLANRIIWIRSALVQS